MHRPSLLLLAASVASLSCRSADKAATARADSAGAPPPAATGATASTGASSADADLREIASYQLTMDKVNKWFDAQRNMAIKVKAMTPAERETLGARSSVTGGMGDMAARIEANPALNAALRDAGLTAREYATLTMAMVQSGMAASVLKMRPKDNQDSLVREMKASMANITFMREHEAELTRKQQAMEAEMKRLGVRDSS